MGLNSLTFRKGTLSDLDGIKKLGSHTWSSFKTELTPENWTEMETNLELDSTYSTLLQTAECFLCELNREIIGMAYLVPKGNPTEIYLESWSYIRFVTVHSSHQGKGIGRILTEKCLKFARENGESHVALHTSDMMVPAQKLYHSLGFRQVKALPDKYGRKYFLFLLNLI